MLSRLLIAVALAMMAALPALGAGEELPEPESTVSCTVELDGRKLIRGEGKPPRPALVVDRTEPIPLPQPLGPGLVGVAGIHEDETHLRPGEPDQEHERFFAIFVDADGEFVGFSEPTPDLPADIARADFRLPAVSLDGVAVSVVLVHAGPGVGSNSIRPVCLEIAPVIELQLTALPAEGPDPALRDVACADSLVPSGTRCIALDVPEDRSDPGSRQITLAAYVLPATGPSPAPDPIFYLRGGPGGSGIGAVRTLAGLSGLRAERDIVVVDQRGTGFSEPALTCPEVGEVSGPDAGSAALGAAWRACNTRLRAAGIDLEAYSTAEAAADLEDLRRALDLPPVNLYGTSYGSSVALAMMAAFPEAVRSSVLDGPYPPQVNGLSDDPRGLHWLIDIVPAVCAADAECAAAYPDVRGDLIAAVDALDRAPVALPGNGSGARVNGLALLSLVVADISRPELPGLFSALATGTPRQRATALAGFLGVVGPSALLSTTGRDADRDQRLTLAEGTFATVTCSEEAAYRDRPATIFPATVWSPRIDGILASRAELLAFICDNWDVGAAPLAATAPVSSPAPTLILAGGADPQTPLPWAVLTGRSLPGSTLAVIPRGGHVVSLSGNRCARSIMAEFVTTPAVSPDVGCTRAEPPIRYASGPVAPSSGLLPPLPAQAPGV